MKKSGVDWIGDMPDDWDVNRVGQFFRRVKNPNSGMRVTNLLSLSYGKIKRRDINTGEGLLPESFEGYNIINKDDIVLRMTDLQNDHTSLRQGIAEEIGIITSAYITIRAVNGIDPKYAYYQFLAYDIVKGWYGMGNGVRQGVNFNDIKKMQIVVPPLNQQQRISSYLDNFTQQIDQLIQDTEKSIEAITEYTQGLITTLNKRRR